jgi:8-oxo-dGTP pyrophosphatase MutT (NUDIX family)
MSYITIYFNEKPVFLCDEISKEISDYRNDPGAIFIDQPSEASIGSLIHQIKDAKFKLAIIYSDDLQKLKQLFFSHFIVIKAAGGLVKNDLDEILLIFRRGKWDLPKGKLDENESIAECALREVREETGLTQLEIGAPLGSTFHTYSQYDREFLKESHWFAMKAVGDQNLVPQTEEDITEIIWAKPTQLEKYLQNTFPTIADIIKSNV